MNDRKVALAALFIILLLGGLQLQAEQTGEIIPTHGNTRDHYVHSPAPVMPEEIATDRPDFTESELVVPAGMIQIENGMTFERDNADYNFGLPESLFRFGTTDTFEFRVGAPLFNVQKTGGERDNGWGDTYLGFKYQIGPLPGDIGLSIIPAVFAPTGDNGYTSDAWDPEVKICYSKDIDEVFSIAGMSYFSLPTENGERNWAYQQTATFNMGVTNKVGAFIEYAGSAFESGTPEHLLHQGFTYLLNNNNLLDVHYGLGVNEAATGDFLAAGWSVRF